jgi:hypothetical protein
MSGACLITRGQVACSRDPESSIPAVEQHAGKQRFLADLVHLLAMKGVERWSYQTVSSMLKALTKDDLKAEAELSEDADLIVNRTAHFVGDWIEEHVIEKPTIVPVGVDAAEELASQCIADAEEEGIAAEDIQDEVGDLKEYIAETIVEEGGSLGPVDAQKRRGS